MKLLIWPIPALLAWGSSWLIFAGLKHVGAPEWVGLTVATFWGGILTSLATTKMRRILILVGFPLSMWAASGALTMPPIGWLLLLGLIVVIYPRKAWKDAPLFPTPRRALRQLPEHITLLGGARILDAGSGLGDGLIALRDAYPRADLNGVEMSWPLRIISAIRCSFATIRQGDIWMVDWRSYDMVYMFQRPESMPNAPRACLVLLKKLKPRCDAALGWSVWNLRRLVLFLLPLFMAKTLVLFGCTNCLFSDAANQHLVNPSSV